MAAIDHTAMTVPAAIPPGTPTRSARLTRVPPRAHAGRTPPRRAQPHGEPSRPAHQQNSQQKVYEKGVAPDCQRAKFSVRSGAPSRAAPVAPPAWRALLRLVVACDRGRDPPRVGGDVAEHASERDGVSEEVQAGSGGRPRPGPRECPFLLA